MKVMEGCQSCVLVFLFFFNTQKSIITANGCPVAPQNQSLPFWFILSAHTNELVYSICFVCNTTDHWAEVYFPVSPPFTISLQYSAKNDQ